MKHTWGRILGLSVTLVSLALGGCYGADEAEAEEGVAADDVYGNGRKLAFDEYTVLFTNPTCQSYPYGAGQNVVANDGTALLAKPKDAYCTSADMAASAARESSPEHKLISWIRDPEVTEIFFAYLSFSNRAVGAELCTAVRERDVKITFVLDRETSLAAANELLACKPKSGDPARAPRLELRGHDGSIGYAHNKLFFFNPSSAKPRIVFSSGNLTSGTSIHHENWHFLRVPGTSHFAGAHRCLVEGLLEHGTQKTDFRTFVDGCRKALPKKEESDLRTFFVPGDGNRASGMLVDGIAKARSIDIATHRFSYSTMVNALEKRLASESPAAVRIVADDDLWWAGRNVVVGPNEPREFASLSRLTDLGATASFLETNHGAHYLQHNKFVVFDMPSTKADAVFAGAGNFTGTAFTDNFENFYYISIPSVVAAFREQYTHMVDDLATTPERLPSANVLPKDGAPVPGPEEQDD